MQVINLIGFLVSVSALIAMVLVIILAIAGAFDNLGDLLITWAAFSLIFIGISIVVTIAQGSYRSLCTQHAWPFQEGCK